MNCAEKNIRANNLLQFIHQVTIEIRFRKSLAQERFRSSVRLFADDCVLYGNIYSIQDCLTMQEDLASLGQWEANWQMKSMWPNVTP